MADTPDGWTYWRNARRGVYGTITQTNPQWGYYKHHSGHPVAIYPDDDGNLWVRVAEDYVSDTVEQGKIWMGCAKGAVSFDHYEVRMKTGMWPGLPDAFKATPRDAVPGDNSGDLDAFQSMQADIENAVAAAKAFEADWNAKPESYVHTKDEADHARDMGLRLAAMRAEADKMRLAATAPLRKQVDDINAQWAAIIAPAQRQSVEMNALADDWTKAEADRVRRAMQAEADERYRKEQEERAARLKAEAEAASKAAAETGDAPQPVAEPEPAPPAPVVAAPKIMTGSGNYGRRSGARTAAPTAVIVDAKAAASYFAEMGAPDVIEAVQKCANRAAKARTKVPGIRFSWEGETQKESA